jgi:hypothetical protein
MTESEQKLLVALVLMVNQHPDSHGDEVDTFAVSAGEHAIEALSDFGLIELVNTRLGRWTETPGLMCPTGTPGPAGQDVGPRIKRK